MPLHSQLAVIDLFAGPGGLGEGFSACAPDGRPAFGIRLSIEKDPQAHATLELRSFVRKFPRHRIPEQYYDFLRDADVPPAVRRKRLFDWFPDEADRKFLTTTRLAPEREKRGAKTLHRSCHRQT